MFGRAGIPYHSSPFFFPIFNSHLPFALVNFSLDPLDKFQNILKISLDLILTPV